MREYRSRANGGQRAQARPAPRHLTRRTTSTSKHSRCGGCIPSRLLRKCSAATSSRLQAGGHRVGALLRAHGLGRASEERFQGKRLGRQQSSVLAASKQSVNGSPFHGNHHGMGQPQRCLLPRRGIGQLQRCLLPTSPPTPTPTAAQPKCPCDDVPTLGRFSGPNHNGIYFIGQLGAVVSGAFIVPILPKLLPASQVPIGLPTQWLDSCLP